MNWKRTGSLSERTGSLTGSFLPRNNDGEGVLSFTGCLFFPDWLFTPIASSLGKSELKRPERPGYSEKNLPSQRMGAGERHCTPTLRKHAVFYLRCLSCKKESGMRWFFKVLFIFDCVVVIPWVTKGIAEEGLISCLWFLSMRGSVFAFQGVCFND